MGRNIKPALVDWIRPRIDAQALQAALTAQDPRTIYLLACKAMVGIREATGHNDGRLVELIQSTLGGAEGESWCMSAQQSGIAFAEELTGITSLVFASEHCLTVWERSPLGLRVKSVPLPGALTIWRHGQTEQGHTGCTGTFNAVHGIFESYEGNTGGSKDAAGHVVREGDGFYQTHRSVHGDGDMRVQGWLKPWLAVT